MSPFFTLAASLVLGLIIAGALLFGGAPLLLLPIIVVPFLVFWLSGAMRRARQDRDLAHHREQAKAEKVDFTERDKQTLTR